MLSLFYKTFVVFVYKPILQYCRVADAPPRCVAKRRDDMAYRLMNHKISDSTTLTTILVTIGK